MSSSSSRTNWSSATQDAIQRLRTLKPNDGWSIERKQLNNNPSLVRLLRRNVPVTDSYFMDLQYDRTSNSIVGLLSFVPSNGKVQAQVLVDCKNGGKILNCHKEVKLISVVRNTNTYATTRNSTKDADGIMYTEEQKQQMILYFGYAIVAMVLARIVFSTFILTISLFVVPIVYIFLLNNCPPDGSFDVKKELKRVLRGQHLPENHPDKPKGFLAETLARAAASVATELATLPGYEVTTWNVYNAAIVKSVRVPTANLQFHWIGAMNQWYYIYSSEINKTNQ